ncbi:MAG: Ig-like domain-containing protein [bacterium]
MKFRVYGEVKDNNTGQAVIGASAKLFLNNEELQQGKSAKNGFYEIIVEIDDSRIESGQQLLLTFEMEGYQKQEHHVLATEGAFNLDTKLDAAVLPPKKPFNWLPVVIAGGVVLLLAVVGVVLFLVLRPKAPKITSFSANPVSIESGKSATLSWETKKASTVEILIDQNIVPVDLNGNKQVTPLQTAEYTLIARNEKGETRLSQTVEVKDVVPPELTVALSPSHPNMGQKVIFTVTASDLGGISKVEILVDGQKVSECNESPCTYEGGPYPLGTVNYEAYAWDNSENKAVSGPNSITIEDIGEPEATIAVNPSTPTIKEKVTFTATATDPGGIKKIEIYVKGTKVKECNESSCTYVGGPYSLGSISYEAHAWDNSGNEVVAGPNSFTTKDEDAPYVDVAHSPSRPTIEEKVTFTAKASDPGGISKVQIFVNGGRVKECPDSPCTYVGGPYPLGTVTYEAYAWDRSNLKAGTGSKSFAALDTVKPKISISASPAKPSTEEKVTFTATASDSGGISKVQIYVNGKKVEECTGIPCRYMGGPYPLGNVSYYAYAYDMAGNSASSGSMSLTTVDKIPPKVSITPAPFTVNLNQKVTFTATASDEGGVSKIQININGSKVKECTGSSCSYTSGPYGAGSNLTYQAYAWDKSGNRAQTEPATLTVMNYNFESGNLDGWSRAGTAFSFQPTLGDNPTMRQRGQPSKHQGNYWIGTYEKHPSTKFAGGTTQGDAPTGILTSKPFVIQSSKASFLVGGGAGSNVGVQLLVEGKVALVERGKNTETMSRVTWDLSKFINKTAQLRIVDNETGGWGHINFDDFQFVYFTFPIKILTPAQPLKLDVIKELPKVVVPKSP